MGLLTMTYPYTSHPSTSTALPVLQEYQNAATATSEKIAEPSTSRPSSTSRMMTDMVNGDVKVLCMNRRGTVTLYPVSAVERW